MDVKQVKKCRKTIDIREVAATDKENITRKIGPKKKFILNNERIRLVRKEGKGKESKQNIVDMKNNINKIKNDNPQKKHTPAVIIASDLTNETPSENYWENLAESRRVALESALKENINLNNKLSEMEYENSRLKEMLSEAQTLVEVLTEMLEGNKDDDVEEEVKQEENVLPGKSDEVNSDSDQENESFQSCI